MVNRASGASLRASGLRDLRASGAFGTSLVAGPPAPAAGARGMLQNPSAATASELKEHVGGTAGARN